MSELHRGSHCTRIMGGIRPLFIVEDNHQDEKKDIQMLYEKIGGYTWNDLVATGCIEYVDTEEEETIMIGDYR